MVNMGQGFLWVFDLPANHYQCSDPHSGYNPPRFVIDAAKEALERVDCNQYSPTQV